METWDILVVALQLCKQIRQRLDQQTAQTIFQYAGSQRVVTDTVIRANLNEEERRIAGQRVANEHLNQVERIRNLMTKPYNVIPQRAEGGLSEVDDSHGRSHAADRAKISPARACLESAAFSHIVQRFG